MKVLEKKMSMGEANDYIKRHNDYRLMTHSELCREDLTDGIYLTSGSYTTKEGDPLHNPFCPKVVYPYVAASTNNHVTRIAGSNLFKYKVPIKRVKE